MRRADSNAALLDAAAQGNTRELDVALKSGADVNTIGPRGWTALHWTAMHGYADLTTKLIEAGADPNMKTRNDKTPLDWAKGMKRADLLQTLNQVTAYRPGVSSPNKGVL